VVGLGVEGTCQAGVSTVDWKRADCWMEFNSASTKFGKSIDAPAFPLLPVEFGKYLGW
jgi:hypothetical protein